MPKVSIIVAVYNAEKQLCYCLDSILKQVFCDFEVILINDGSLDNSGTICNNYKKKDRRVKVIHKSNGGVSSARNAGIEIANGDYICFIDSDDYVSENYLEQLILAKQKFHTFDNIWCGFQTISGYNKSLESIIHVVSSESCFFKSNRTEIMYLHEKWLSQTPWNKMYETRIIKKHNIKFQEDMSLGEDLLFNLEYLDSSNGKILLINKPLYYYVRNGNESLDNKYYSDLFEIYKKINSELLRYLTHWKCSGQQLTRYYNSCFYSYEKVLRNTFHKNNSTKHKIKYNRAVLKSNEFINSINHCDCYINPLYKFCYKHALPICLRILDTIVL